MKRTFATLTLVAALGAMYARLLRRPILTWGATEAEATARLPGDELLEDADGIATRAITIDAPPSAVWPWLAQMGPSPRGGAYTYDWLENLLRLDMHSVDRVLPEYQHPQVGEGFGFGENQMRYARVDPEHVLALRSLDGNWVWSFVLEERDGRTRLISRNRFRLPRLRDRLGMVPMEPGVARDGAEDAARDPAASGTARRTAIDRVTVGSTRPARGNRIRHDPSRDARVIEAGVRRGRARLPRVCRGLGLGRRVRATGDDHCGLGRGRPVLAARRP